jgi:serine/threonine protein kinase
MTVQYGTRFGPYEIVCPIGAGGMGMVYEARDVRLGRQVAIKMLTDKCSCDGSRLRRFEQEARALSSINHPNVVTIYALGDQDRTYHIVMEFVKGSTLRRLITAGRLRLCLVLEIGTQVASALCAAHSAGVVHRDIKPENVMLRPDGLVKVLDFGLAKLNHSCVARSNLGEADILTEDNPGLDSGAAASQHAVTAIINPVEATGNRIMGTTAYMSPEQVRGREVDARTDIFSLGVTLYELVAGVTPFGGTTQEEVFKTILEREPPPLECFRPGIPRDLARIIGKALRKDREVRYQNIKDLLIDLQDVKMECERKAASTRSVHYQVIGESGAAIVRRHYEGDPIHLGSFGVSTSRSAHFKPASGFEDCGRKGGATPVLPVDWVVLIGWNQPGRGTAH